LRDLPATPFEPCHKCSTKVSSMALVCHRLNDYSVPATYGFRDLLVKGFVDQWRFSAAPSRLPATRAAMIVASFVFDARHYLALL
jgi:hypothetical protein